MIFNINELKIEITIEHYSPEQKRTLHQEGGKEDFEFSGVFLDEVGKEICIVPDELIWHYKKEIIEMVKEES